MTVNRKIQSTELDFDAIKENLKEYLRGQSQFSDYNFEGSGLSTLLDILAYNTHYNSLYTNLAINEAFLDSASKRSSVISKAREIGYTPYSSKCATAIINVIMVNTQISAPDFIEIPRGTPFLSTVNGTTYSFYTVDTNIAYKNDIMHIFQFNNIVIKEGTLLQYQYIADVNNRSFLIPNPNVDTSTIKVTIQDNPQSSNITTFVNANNIINIDSESPVYFLKEIDNGFYEIEFGNGIIGKSLNAGNQINIEYIVCNQDAPNDAKTFTYNGEVLADYQISTFTVAPAFGGSGPESINSIKWNAPRSYSAQNRAVTEDDYKALINSMYPDNRAISVWGGESNDPPVYGKVFISIVPKSKDVLSDDDKQYILDNIINPRKVLSVIPEFVDAIPLKIGLDVSFYYNPLRTTKSSGDISNLILQTINNYNINTLNTFGGIFKHSRLSTLIDQADPSITSNTTTVSLYRELQPNINVNSSYNISINNPLQNSGIPGDSIISTGFLCSDSKEICVIEDIGDNNTTTGTLRLYYHDINGQKIVIRNIGTIDYSKGEIIIIDLNITGLPTPLVFTIKPKSYDVLSTYQQVAMIDFDRVTITPILDTVSQPYKFTSSRN